MGNSSISFILKHTWDEEYDRCLGTRMYEIAHLSCSVYLDGFSAKKSDCSERRLVIQGQKIIFKEDIFEESTGYEEVIKSGTRIYPYKLNELLEVLESNKEAMWNYIENKRKLYQEKAKEKVEWTLKKDIKMEF